LGLAIKKFSDLSCQTDDKSSISYGVGMEPTPYLQRRNAEESEQTGLAGFPTQSINLRSYPFCQITFQHSCPCFKHAYEVSIKSQKTGYEELLDIWTHGGLQEGKQEFIHMLGGKHTQGCQKQPILKKRSSSKIQSLLTPQEGSICARDPSRPFPLYLSGCLFVSFNLSLIVKWSLISTVLPWVLWATFAN
jgi:hypothetical protein